MEPQNLRFGGGSTATLLHPLVAVAMLLAIVLVFCLPRKQVIIPLLLGVMLIPKGQVIVVAGVHFTAAKILFLTGMLRWLIMKGSLTLEGRFGLIDRFFALWAFAYPLVFTLQWMAAPAFIKCLGDSIDTFCGYFVLRFFIRDDEDVRRVMKVLVVVSALVAVCMVNEHVNQRNFFGLLGGVAASPDVRDGKIRANGVFQHSILAGCFGATLLPVLAAFWYERKYRKLIFIGVISSLTIVAMANGSTPLLGLTAGIIGVCCWPLRRNMRGVRWGILAILIGLHLVMNGPVWSLIEKVDLTGSSSSYHRYMLMDNCIRHFWDWWTLGVKNYDSWGFDMWDLSNQYVAYAVTGGLVTLGFFIAIISSSFGAVGTARKIVAGERRREWFFWCLGSALLAHVMSYFGIGYFDQMQFAWFALLAIICATTYEAKQRLPVQHDESFTPEYACVAAVD